MKIVEVLGLPIPEIKVVRFARFADERGYFTEVFRRRAVDAHPETTFLRGVAFPQSNESRSRPGTIRGLHFQWNPYQGKLVRTVHGHMIDLVLDIRMGSPTFGRIVAHDMPADADQPFGEWIWIPPGFAHGNVFLEETLIEYYCTGEYNPRCEAAVSPLASDIDWSLCSPGVRAEVERIAGGSVRMSGKDRSGLTMAEWSRDPRSEHFLYGAKELCGTGA